MKKEILKIWTLINFKIKNYINMRKDEYRFTGREYNINKLTYEDYILRGQISVFKYIRDL